MAGPRLNRISSATDLYERHGPWILRRCRRYARDPEEARDLAQEVLLKAYAALPRFAEESALFTWVYRITVNACIDHIRKRRNREAFLLRFAAEPPGPESSGDRREMALWLDQVAAGLPGLDKRIAFLKIMEGLTDAEAAEVLGLTARQVQLRFLKWKTGCGKRVAHELR